MYTSLNVITKQGLIHNVIILIQSTGRRYRVACLAVNVTHVGTYSKLTVCIIDMYILMSHSKNQNSVFATDHC